jgi:protease-4
MDEQGMPAQRASGQRPDGWERKLIEELALSALREKRVARRWSIFFRLASLAVAAVMIALWTGLWDPTETAASGKHTALVDVEGVIESKGEASAEAIAAGLRAAFADANTAGVVLRINSPGGSPVQAGIVHDEIRRLRAKHPDVPLYAVVEEVCASGGYYIAAAADRIYVDKASLVGSIGVLMDGFGFVGTMEKLGVERRLLTAGENKAFMDSFSPMAEKDRKHLQSMLDEIHRQFVEAVRTGRGERLKEDADTFSGLVWTGARSVELGLADSLGNVEAVARDVIQAENIVDFTRKQNIAERLAKRVGAGGAQALWGLLGLSAEPARLR